MQRVIPLGLWPTGTRGPNHRHKLSRMIIAIRSFLDEIQVPLATRSRCSESAIASFAVDGQNQQNHIAHAAIFQRAGNSEGCKGIDDDGKKDTDLYDMEWASQSRR